MADSLSLTSDVVTQQSRPLAIEVDRVSRTFGSLDALDNASLQVREGEIHALLGPNGAGKTTLLRILTGLVDPTGGQIRLLGIPSEELGYRRYRSMFGFVPSGDRSFYLRISGVENLLFFGRMHAFRRRDALNRAWASIRAVGLEEAALKPVGLYSHGMQKRLSVARGLLAEPVILFIDEATHDLDPVGAHTVQQLVSEAAGRGTAVLWATQRLDEIRGFAHQVTVLDRGRVRFTGTVPELMAISLARRYVLHLRSSGNGQIGVLAAGNSVLQSMGTLELAGDVEAEHCLLELGDGVVLGEALASLTAAGIQVLACREERSGIENAFLHLTRRETA
jgi:ABC-type multidrug transport system ATPase subunit